MWLDLALALLVVAALDFALFHEGLYFGHLKPESYSGRLQKSSAQLEAAMASFPDRPLVLAIGDSTGRSGIDAPRLEDLLGARGVDRLVFNYSQPGSTARSWYLLTKHSRFDSSSTALVVVAVVPTSLRRFEEVKPDLAIVKTELGLGDGWVLAGSYVGLEQRLRVLSGTLFRTPWFRDDLRDYAANPRRRWADLERNRQQISRDLRRGSRGFSAATGSMKSARLDEEGNLVVSELAPHLEGRASLHPLLEGWLRMRRLPATRKIDFDERKLEMLDLLVENLDDRGVPVLVAVLPRMPALFRDREIEPLRRRIESLQKAGRAVHWFEDSDLLARLERPDYYSDHLHLNATGARVYTDQLALTVEGILRAGLRLGETPREAG